MRFQLPVGVTVDTWTKNHLKYRKLPVVFDRAKPLGIGRAGAGIVAYQMSLNSIRMTHKDAQNDFPNFITTLVNYILKIHKIQIY